MTIKEVFRVRMYPDQLDGNHNEISLPAENEKDALTKAMGHFRSEDWRRQGTFFEVRSESVDNVLLRAAVKPGVEIFHWSAQRQYQLDGSFKIVKLDPDRIWIDIFKPTLPPT
jgi:hypothetical protein